MLRSFIEEFLLFIVPFFCFALFLVAQRRNPFDVEHWQGKVFRLAVAGLILGIASFLYEGLTAPRHTGAFSPPHMENGRLVPGQFNDAR